MWAPGTATSPRHSRELLPGHRVEGLDLGSGVELGAQRGWLARGHRALFLDCVEELAGRFRRAEHGITIWSTPGTRGPNWTARPRVLRPGSYLLIEMPDPDYNLAPAFGRWWFPLLQPQHQHMIPLPNLLGAFGRTRFPTAAHHPRAGAHRDRRDVGAGAVVRGDRPRPEPALADRTGDSGPAPSHELVWQKLAPKGFAAMHKVDAVLGAIAAHRQREHLPEYWARPELSRLPGGRVTAICLARGHVLHLMRLVVVERREHTYGISLRDA